MGFINKMMRTYLGGLSCEEANEFLAAYLDDDLEPELKRHFETHLRRCSVCDHYLSQYRDTVSIIQEDCRNETPPELIDHTLAFLREHIDFAK